MSTDGELSDNLLVDMVDIVDMLANSRFMMGIGEERVSVVHP